MASIAATRPAPGKFAVAPALVRRDGWVQAGGHPAGHARLGALERQLDDLLGPGVIDEIAAQATLTGKVKGKARRAMPAPQQRRCGAGQVEQVRALGLIQLQGAGECVKDGVGGAAGVAAFQAGVVVDAEPGQQRDLLPAEPGDAAAGAIGGQARLLGGDPGPPGGQEVTDLAPVSTATRLRRPGPGWGVLSVPGTTGTPTPDPCKVNRIYCPGRTGGSGARAWQNGAQAASRQLDARSQRPARLAARTTGDKSRRDSSCGQP